MEEDTKLRSYRAKPSAELKLRRKRRDLQRQVHVAIAEEMRDKKYTQRQIAHQLVTSQSYVCRLFSLEKKRMQVKALRAAKILREEAKREAKTGVSVTDPKRCDLPPQPIVYGGKWHKTELGRRSGSSRRG